MWFRLIRDSGFSGGEPGRSYPARTRAQIQPGSVGLIIRRNLRAVNDFELPSPGAFGHRAAAGDHALSKVSGPDDAG